MGDGLMLTSECLMSKWGFFDGDEPEEFMDYCDEQRISYRDLDWHTLLQRMVRKYLLPEIQKHQDVQLVDVDTIHNPIRAEFVEGVDVSDNWVRGTASVSIVDASVTVLWATVVEEIDYLRLNPRDDSRGLP